VLIFCYKCAVLSQVPAKAQQAALPPVHSQSLVSQSTFVLVHMQPPPELLEPSHWVCLAGAQNLWFPGLWRHICYQGFHSP
jgi:hypothetical protein